MTFDDQRAAELYDQGMNDRQIAEAIGTYRERVMRWRKATGRKKVGRAKVLDRAQARTLYDQGMNDEKIAAACGVSAPAVWQWRKATGLPSHAPQRRKRAKFDHDRARKMFEAGATNVEVAKAMGVVLRTVEKWRRRLRGTDCRLPAVQPPKPPQPPKRNGWPKPRPGEGQIAEAMFEVAQVENKRMRKTWKC